MAPVAVRYLDDGAGLLGAEITSGELRSVLTHVVFVHTGRHVALLLYTPGRGVTMLKYLLYAAVALGAVAKLWTNSSRMTSCRV